MRWIPAVVLRNDAGDTALIYAVQANSIDIVERLVEAGVNVTRKKIMGSRHWILLKRPILTCMKR